MGLVCSRRLRFGLGTGIDSRLEEMTRTVRPTACIVINSNSEHTSCTICYTNRAQDIIVCTYMYRECSCTLYMYIYMYMYMYIHVYTCIYMYLVWTVAAVEAVSHSLSATSDSQPQPAQHD